MTRDRASLGERRSASGNGLGTMHFSKPTYTFYFRRTYGNLPGPHFLLPGITFDLNEETHASMTMWHHDMAQDSTRLLSDAR